MLELLIVKMETMVDQSRKILQKTPPFKITRGNFPHTDPVNEQKSQEVPPTQIDLSPKINNSKTAVLENLLGPRVLDFARNKFPIIGFGLVSTAHLLSGLHMFFNILPSGIGDFLDKNSLKATKLVKSINYLLKGVESLLVGRSVEAMTKLILPFIYFKSKLENLHTMSGIISGISLVEASQIPKTIHMKNTNHFFNNFINNFITTKEMIKEIFNFKKLTKDHLLFVGGLIKFIGSLLGTIFEENTQLRRFYTIIRNTGSVAGDVSKLFQKDINWIISGTLFPIASLFDIIQNFTDDTKQRRAFSHLSFVANSLANFFYLNITKSRTDGTYKI